MKSMAWCLFAIINMLPFYHLWKWGWGWGQLYTGIAVTLNNASDYWANGLLSDYIGWTNRLTG